MKYLLLVALLLVLGCVGNNATGYSALALRPAGLVASEGDRANFDYVLRLGDDTLVGSGSDEVILGSGQEIAGYSLDRILLGMSPGEAKKVMILPEEAYGPYDPAKTISVRTEQLTENGIIPVTGMTVIVGANQGIIKAISGERVELDLNHPLAGQTLFLDLELTNIA